MLTSFSNEVQSIDPYLNYWGEKPLNNGVNFVGYSNSSSLFGALKSKQIDVLLSNSIDDSQRKTLNNLSKNKQFNEGNSPFTELSFISLKTSSYPLSNLNLRLALAKSLNSCLLYTSPSPRDRQKSRMPSSA